MKETGDMGTKVMHYQKLQKDDCAANENILSVFDVLEAFERIKSEGGSDSQVSPIGYSLNYDNYATVEVLMNMWCRGESARYPNRVDVPMPLTRRDNIFSNRFPILWSTNWYVIQDSINWIG